MFSRDRHGVILREAERPADMRPKDRNIPGYAPELEPLFGIFENGSATPITMMMDTITKIGPISTTRSCLNQLATKRSTQLG